MGNVREHHDAINPQATVCYFDKIAFRTARRLDKEQMQFLRAHSASVDCREGRPIRNSNEKLRLTVFRPDDACLGFLAEVDGLRINHVEIACDMVMPDEPSKDRLHDLFDRHFVQPWHRGRETVFYKGTAYTGPRDASLRYVWYSDRPAKVSGEPQCLHIEARFAGAVSVRRLGLHETRDLLNFDHRAFWQRHLRLYEIDYRRLGRWHSNRRSRQRRQAARLVQCGPFSYDVDRRLGCTIYRLFAAHPNIDRHSVQRFIDQFGRGPFLRPLDTTPLLIRSHNQRCDLDSLMSSSFSDENDDGKPDMRL